MRPEIIPAAVRGGEGLTSLCTSGKAIERLHLADWKQLYIRTPVYSHLQRTYVSVEYQCILLLFGCFVLFNPKPQQMRS